MAEELLAYALTTVARVKNRLGITADSHDTLIEEIINGVTDFIESQTNRKFKETTHTEIHSYNYDRPDTIFLKNRPVSSVTSVKYRQGLFNVPNYTDISATDWILQNNGNEGIIQIAGGWLYRGTNVVQVVYIAGYKINFTNAGDDDTHTLPADITELCEKLVSKAYNKRDNEGKESISVSATGGGTTRYLKELTEDEKATLVKYTIVPAFV